MGKALSMTREIAVLHLLTHLLTLPLISLILFSSYIKRLIALSMNVSCEVNGYIFSPLIYDLVAYDQRRALPNGVKETSLASSVSSPKVWFLDAIVLAKDHGEVTTC